MASLVPDAAVSALRPIANPFRPWSEKPALAPAEAETTETSPDDDAAPRSPSEEARVEQLLHQQHRRILRHTDRRLSGLMIFQWLAGVAAAIWITPYTWAGTSSAIHPHLVAAVFLGAAIIALPVALGFTQPGRTLTRHAIAAGQMLYGGLLIHLSGGRIETHFHVFGSLAFLAFYRDWRVLVTASAVVALDHLLRGVFWPESIYGVAVAAGSAAAYRRVLEHVGWVLFEDIFLIASIRTAYNEMRRTARDQAKLETLNADIRAAKKESDTIMETITQGLFLIDRQGEIGVQYSKVLEKIFPVGALAGRHFLELLQPLVSAKIYADTRDYLELMFNAAKKEKQVAKLNPLTAVEVCFAEVPEHFGAKHLEFRFSRVAVDGQITHLLVAVQDATRQVALAQQLQRTEQRREKQVETLFNILHVDPALLQEFMASAEESLLAANASLSEAPPPGAEDDGSERLRHKLDAVLRNVHALKGNAGMLRLGFFEQKAHDLEEKILELRARSQLNGDDLLPMVLLQSEFQAHLEDTRRLLERFGGAAPADDPPITAPRAVDPLTPAILKPGATGEELLDALDGYAQSLAVGLGKKVHFTYDGFPAARLPERHRALFRDLLIQLIRNAVSHGIEPPAERTALGKPRHGSLELRLLDDGAGSGGFVFCFRDDGQGLHTEKLRARAARLGYGSAEEISRWEPERVAALIFEPGFSTAEAVNAAAGRGVGMNLIKTRVADDCGGEIAVESTAGEGCTFHIALPA